MKIEFNVNKDWNGIYVDVYDEGDSTHYSHMGNFLDYASAVELLENLQETVDNLDFIGE